MNATRRSNITTTQVKASDKPLIVQTQHRVSRYGEVAQRGAPTPSPTRGLRRLGSVQYLIHAIRELRSECRSDVREIVAWQRPSRVSLEVAYVIHPLLVCDREKQIEKKGTVQRPVLPPRSKGDKGRGMRRRMTKG